MSWPNHESREEGDTYVCVWGWASAWGRLLVWGLHKTVQFASSLKRGLDRGPFDYMGLCLYWTRSVYKYKYAGVYKYGIFYRNHHTVYLSINLVYEKFIFLLYQNFGIPNFNMTKFHTDTVPYFRYTVFLRDTWLSTSLKIDNLSFYNII